MILLGGKLPRFPRLEFFILSLDGLLEPFSFVLLHPIGLLLHLLVGEHILLSGVVDVFQQRDAGVLLSLPLGFSHLILSFGLSLHELINFFLIGLLV